MHKFVCIDLYRNISSNAPIYIVNFLLRVLFIILLGLSTAAAPLYAQVFQHIVEKPGAPTNEIMSITQDKAGFMWFGTTGGLYRFDTYAFKVFRHDPKDTKSVASNFIRVVFCDAKGALWAGSQNGLSRYDRQSESFQTFRFDRSNSNSISSDTILSISEDSQQNLWVGTSNGLNRVELKDGKIVFKRFLNTRVGSSTYVINGIAPGEKQQLWLATNNGLVSFNQGKVRLFQANPDSRFISVNDFKSLFKDDSGNIWLGLRPGGLMQFNIASGTFRLVEHFKGWDGNLPDLSGMAIASPGKIWIATMAGLAYLDVKTLETKWYINNPADDQSLSDNAIMCLFKDRQNGIWLGTYDLGIDYLNTSLPLFSKWPFFVDRLTNNKFNNGWMGLTPDQKPWMISADKKQLIWYDPATNQTSIHNLNLDFTEGVNHFFIDEQGIIWCGENWLLKSYDFRKGTRKDYPFPKRTDAPFKRSTIFRIFQDSHQQLWAGGRFGLFSFDKRTGVSRDWGLETTVVCTFEDSKGNIWVGGSTDVWRIPNGSQTPERFPLAKPKSAESGGFQSAWRVTEDRKGRIWAATNQGLQLYNPRGRHFSFIDTTSRSLAASIDDIQTDRNGFLWLSQRSDLVRYHPDRRTIQTYSYQDGIPRKSALATSTAAKNQAGMLFYNTSKEMFSFDPDKVFLNDRSEKIVLSSLRLFNRAVKADDETGILNQDASLEKELTFRHNQNIFSLDFALLSFARSSENLYQYRMEGFEDKWNETSVPTATYMNLPPGDYTFVVRAANGDGFWMKEPLKLKITILPPWWKTWYAYLFYLLVIAGAIYAINRFFWLRSSFRKENALNQVKLDFFTNVSHEIRTHLSLISGPLEKVHQQLQNGENVERNVNYARNSSDRLMLLVNELLDFRKIQSGGVRLQVREHDVVKVIKSIIAAFEHISREKEIETSLICPDTPVLLWFDIAQMQKVFYNLLSNAYKFTPEGGQVSVRITEISKEVNVIVENNGKGISPDHLKKLFTYYYQADSEKPGYGIGLALSKSIVEQHHGSLSAESRLSTQTEPGVTTLIIRLLRENMHYSPQEIAPRGQHYVSGVFTETVAATLTSDEIANKQLNTILIIEDNDELRGFISELFEGEYNTLEAENGLRGIELANEHIPDIILTDVMMPELNGLQVCNRLKNGADTSHIPVVLLTARTQSEQIIEGLRAGADDYLMKPFDPRIIKLKIDNLLRLRDQMRQRYRESVLEAPEVQRSIAQDKNEVFIAKLKNLVIDHISDVNFGVNELAFEAGTSVSVLYRKLRSLTGMTINEFVKTLRLNEAKKLLESGVYNVSDVATIVGFEDPKYFSKEFRKVFGKTPTEIKKQIPASGK